MTLMKTTPFHLAAVLVALGSTVFAQTVRVETGAPRAAAGAAAAAGAGAGTPSMVLPDSKLSFSMTDGLPSAAPAPKVSPRQSLSVGAEKVGRAPSPEGANAALDSMYTASKAGPAAVVAARYSPSFSGPGLKPSDKDAVSPRAEEVPPGPQKEVSRAETAAQLTAVAAVVAGAAAAFYFFAQAFTSMVVQWEAQIRAASDFWNQMP